MHSFCDTDAVMHLHREGRTNEYVVNADIAMCVQQVQSWAQDA